MTATSIRITNEMRADYAQIDALVATCPSATDLRAFDQLLLKAWLYERAIYCVPTHELVTWLKERICPLAHKTLEIGAGNACLGRLVGVRMIDAAWQNGPLAAYYRAMAQIPTNPPPDVERITARRAIDKYRPHTVIASWVTSRFNSHRGEVSNACFAGVDEMRILRKVRRYILIGCDSSHGEKRILSRRHEIIRPPWIVSRGQGDWIRIWERPSGSELR